MKRNQIRFIIMLGAFAITGIIIVQYYFLHSVWSIKEKQFNQTVNIALRQVAERMSEYNNTVMPHANPVKQLSANYFVVNINDVIDANILEYFLQTEFDKHNIVTDYEYAIYDCHNDVMEYGKYILTDENRKPFRLSTDLPKYDEYMYYFGINFPTRRNYIGSDMTLWIIFSAILLVAVIFFGYAMFVILHQKRLSELQKEFINNMTHEFKTPISSINISADVLSAADIESQPHRIKKYSAIVKQENARLNNLVEKVLQIAHIERGGFDLKKETVVLNELISEVVENIRAKNDLQRDMVIETQLADDTGSLMADPLHLVNVFYNLIDNAIKYADKKPEILISTARKNQFIIIEVKDNGPGIRPEFHSKVFRKFFRVPTGNIHNVKGFGLGLFYVKKICDIHKWSVKLQSEPGQGSSFIIEIRNL